MKNAIRFDSWFKQNSFDSDSIHDSNQNRLQIWFNELYPPIIFEFVKAANIC